LSDDRSSAHGTHWNGRYRLTTQMGAGPEGVRYRALDEQSQGEVELVVLGVTDEDLERTKSRARRLRLAAMLTHASARRVLDLHLVDASPFVVLEPARALSDESRSRSRPDAVSDARELAAGLAEAHRLGLAHGRLTRGIVASPSSNRLKIDWTRLSNDRGSDGDGDQGDESPLQPSHQAAGDSPSPAGDIYELGGLLVAWGTVASNAPAQSSPTAGGPLDSIVRAMRAADPSERPTAREVVEQLTTLLAAATISRDGLSDVDGQRFSFDRGDSLAAKQSADYGPGSENAQLGRFKIQDKLGEGGMGAVFRAEDLADGSIVAIKVLRGASRPEALRRFHKEARLLSDARNPFVTNLIEVNEDRGIHYIALEYVQGVDLGKWMEARGRLDEPTALALVADVARGLSMAHERGIIHRDVKPENILLLETQEHGGAAAKSSSVAVKAPPQTLPRIKLSDFGLARHVEESESLNLTRTGAILGTPLYMAPEQSAGGEVLGPGVDVYALGAMLFRMLAGRPPFMGGSTIELLNKHQNEPPPSLKALNDAVSDGICEVVSKALSKRPEHRYRDAGDMLDDLERLRRGEPTAIAIHPALPTCDPRDLVKFDFQWELDASPLQLWPYVSNTERLNRALGLPAVPFTSEYEDDSGVKRFGALKTAGLMVRWQEHPYEWVEGARMGVLREFSHGPFRWFVSAVELLPRSGGGTLLKHSIRIAAKGLLGRTIAHVKIGNAGGRSMDKVYRRIDAVLTGKLGEGAGADPFEPPTALPADRRRRLDHWLGSLDRLGLDPLVVERFGEFLAEAPAQEVARIRPLALARRLGIDPDQVTTLCLRGAKDGTLILLWDILCPVCRIPSQVIDSLRVLKDHGSCEACHLDFELDFSNSVELIFRAHPEIRDTELGVYCIGGPAHSPHVVAQVRVGPRERISLDLRLAEGAYRLRGPRLAYSVDFRVEPGAFATRWELMLSRAPGPELPRVLRPGGQVLTLYNDTDAELVARVERRTAREDALTAARASALALFRDLFPGEVLTQGQLINIETITLLVTALDFSGDFYAELGDAKAFGVIHEQFRLLDACLRRHAGALIKTVNEGVVAAFSDPASAVEAALNLRPTLAGGELTGQLKLRIAVHRGPALVATLNDHLDYFGTTISSAMRLPEYASSDAPVVSTTVASDPRVCRLLQNRHLSPTIIPIPSTVLAEGFAHRLDPTPETGNL
jgi:eukaryotic-like serine/threonine-protein kinase